MKSVAEALMQYICDRTDAAQIRTAILRYTAPAWGYSPPSCRMNTQDIAQGMEFLQTVPIARLKDALDEQTQLFEQLNSSDAVRTVNRSYLKGFVTWVIDQQLLNPHSIYRFRTVTKERGAQCRDRDRPKRQHGITIALSEQELSGLPHLVSELQSLTAWMHQTGYSDGTIKTTHVLVYQLLGWFHRVKEVAAEDLHLALCTGVNSIQVNPASFGDDYPAYCLAQLKAIDQAKADAAHQIQLLEEFFAFKDNKPSNLRWVLDCLVRVAKYIHREITDRIEYRDTYNDIPIIVQLRLHRKQVEQAYVKQSELIPFERKSISWEQFIAVVEQARLEADMPDRSYCRQDGSIQRDRRSDTAIAHSLQTFLILAFLAVRPPDRSRTLYELEVGKTLLQGRYNGIFTPLNQLSDPATTEWILYLTAKDYKTGKAYGEFYTIIPNVEFADGKLLYDYIDRWLKQYRATLQPQHNRFFTATSSKAIGKPLTSSSIRSAVQHATYRFMGTAVTTKDLRRMYVSYLRDIGADAALLESACYEMHHSRLMQSKVYDQQNGFDKSLPVLEYNAASFRN